MNEKRVWVFCFMVSVLLLGACGGDSASNPESVNDISGESKLIESSSSFVVKSSSSGRTQSSSVASRTSSSSTISSSSSKIAIDPSTVVAGSLNDTRDGQSYRTVKIGKQVWMAENLNYKVENSFCYNDEDSNCDKHGRLYTWSAAITACPNGWHLPSKDEYGTLFLTVGGERIAGKMLKSTSGWSGDGNGTDAYSFAMQPAGFRYDNYDGEGNAAVFWSFYYDVFSDEEKVFWGPYDFLFLDDDGYISEMFSGAGMDELIGASVRCVEGEPSVSINKSSSSSKEESSSSFESSSSENETILIDSRDGQAYRTVKIGTQIWMAQNLNYETASSHCYSNNKFNCTIYGSLYTWADAMDSVKTGCGNGSTCSPTLPVQGICPKGWHLPSGYEWDMLIKAVGGTPVAGKKLKFTKGWDYDGNGTDDYAFSALPIGFRYNNGEFGNKGNQTYFWSSTDGGGYANCLYLNPNDEANLDTHPKDYGFPVRCLKDGSSITPSVVEGTLTDSRDNQIYRTVKIGSQKWMAENLNYESVNSYCYDDDASNCAKYGRLYTWAGAMDSVKTGCGDGSMCTHWDGRGVCPEGWHLPNDDEWKTLFTAVGGESIAYKMLMSTSGWENDGGLDYYAFSVLPAGCRQRGGKYSSEGDKAYFWSSTTTQSHYANYISFGSLSPSSDNKSLGFSVRCVKD